MMERAVNMEREKSGCLLGDTALVFVLGNEENHKEI
jgi:3-oxoacyl-[acyl-carrier-protein] synthase III